MLSRRIYIKCLVLGLGVAVSGHAPWGQWQVYRMRHMLFLSTIEDKPSYPFSKLLVKLFELYLPEASPRPARAKDFRRVHSLLISDQMPVVVLSKNVAKSLILGEKEFKEFGPVQMNLLYDFGDMVLLARPKMPDNHAWRLVDAILRSGEFSKFSYGDSNIPFLLHGGAKKALEGKAIPEEQIDDMEHKD